MLGYEKRQNRFCWKILLVFFLLASILSLCGCSPAGFLGRVHIATNIPVYQTKVKLVNQVDCDLVLQVDTDSGKLVFPGKEIMVWKWVGSGPYGGYSVRLAVTVKAIGQNWSWSRVLEFSSYYPPTYVITVRREGGEFKVELQQ